MLRPEQMSKVSVTGAKSVMEDVIETMHDLRLVHITDYDGSWQGFEPGDSLSGADETSSKLVTVRALESTLDLDPDEIEAVNVDLSSNVDRRLEEVRERVNELDDQRDEKRDRLREIDEQLDQMELFADLGLDLDLLWGYDSLDVLVGEGDPDAVEHTLATAQEVEAYDVFTGEKSLAAFASMVEDERIEDALVGVSLTTYDVPEMTGDPASNVDQLTEEREQIEDEIEQIEQKLAEVKDEHGAFLLALEEELTIQADKMEAPLRFATTERSFIVEGWLPASSYEDLEEQLRADVGEHIEIEELERAKYTGSHEPHRDSADAEDHHGEAATDGGHTQSEVTTDGGRQTNTEAGDDDSKEVLTDGGHDEGVVTVDDDPPVVQRNSKIVNPFEVLTEAVNRPKYSEFDPTITLFLTFPLFFGFMIGDIGYGLSYIFIGYLMYSRFESRGVSNLGAVIVWMGLWTALFGILYGEVFGLHFLYWPQFGGYHHGLEPVLHKGISKLKWAKTWIVIAVIAGWIHLDIGYLLDFIEEFQLHGAKAAIIETGSWILMLNGLWMFIFSKLGAGLKPDLLVGKKAVLNSGPLGFGFAGFPAMLGWVGIGMFALGILLILVGPWYEVFEFLVPLAHTLSYTRLTAVLLAKAGMALAANLLYFGAYQVPKKVAKSHDGVNAGYHFMHAKNPDHVKHGEIIFSGLANMGPMSSIGGIDISLVGALAGLPVLIVAHIVVLAVGGTAAIQAIRLEYFEFFEKFYEGGGKKYEPFGNKRTRTTDN